VLLIYKKVTVWNGFTKLIYFYGGIIMRNRALTLAVVSVLFAVVATGYAGEYGITGTTGQAQSDGNNLGIAVDFTYVSQNVWRGFQTLGARGAIRGNIDLNFYGTGFGLNLGWQHAIGDGVDSQWIPLTFYYQNKFGSDRWTTAYQVGLEYYNFPQLSSPNADFYDLFATAAWPELTGIGLVPHVTLIYQSPLSREAELVNDIAGWMYIVGLGYDIPIGSPITSESPTPQTVVHLSADAVYNDGMGSSFFRGNSNSTEPVDHDWSHAVFGASSEIHITKNLSFTPGVFFQSSWDDSVNSQNPIWVSLSTTYRF
jgi:hypothetical protein